MLEQTGSYFYKFRFLIAGVFIFAFFISISALVTSLGKNTGLAAQTPLPTGIFDNQASDNSDVITDGMSELVNSAGNVMFAAASGVYKACRSVTSTTTDTGRTITRGSTTILHGIGTAGHAIGHGLAFSLRGIGNGSMFVLRIPGRIVGSINNTQAVSAVMRPASDNPVPVINNQLPPALLAKMQAEAQQDQKKDAELQAAQLAANQSLSGTVVAGSANHGGYPSRWDAPVGQDSLLDSWGMYNRECVSYAAWKVYQTYGDMPYWGGVGNANQWVHDAKSAGIPTGSTPRVHSVAISMQGYYGHAMWVEAVKGNMIYVSQYNYDLHGHYSEMWVDGSTFSYIYFS